MPEPSSDIMALRGALAEMQREIKARDKHSDEQDAIINELVLDRDRVQLENAKLRARLAYYENSNSPPSQNSLAWRAKKRARRRERAERGDQQDMKQGRKAGHKGVSHNRRSIRNITYSLEECPNCKSRDITPVCSTAKQVTDIPYLPKAETVTHTVCTYKCTECDTVSASPDRDVIKGTAVGPKLAKYMLRLWSDRVPIRRIAANVRECFDFNACAATVQNTLVAMGAMLEPTAESIRSSMGKSESIHYDETGMSVNGKSRWAWVTTSKESTCIEVMASRGMAVLQKKFPFTDTVAVCDGHGAYHYYPRRQRCWAHPLRESESLILTHPDCTDVHTLHGRLKQLYCTVVDSPQVCDAEHAALVDHTIALADDYAKAGFVRFATKLARAAPYLFTFLLYPGVEPTNNAANASCARL